MGGVTMNLLLGSNPVDNLAPFDTIPGAAATTLMGDAGQMLPDVQRMLPKLDSILTNLNRLSGDPALQQTLTNAAAISENLKTTTAQLDRLMARDVPQLWPLCIARERMPKSFRAIWRRWMCSKRWIA